MNDSELFDELEFRKSVEYDSRFEPRDHVSSLYGFDIVERNGWKGISYGETNLVPTLFDNVYIMPVADRFCAVTSIADKKGAYVISPSEGVPALECLYDDIISSTFHRGIAFAKDGKEGLFSLISMQTVFPCEYLRVSLNVDAYAVWAVKEGGAIDFILSHSGQHIYQSGAIKAFEDSRHILFQDPNGTVRLVNDNGYIDKYAFRKFLADSGGRLILSNSREKRTNVCDISGFIIS